MTLVPVDPTNALAVSDYLDKAKQWLATAVEMTGPAEIAMAKAEIATAAEATKQLHLSQEIQTDALEMVRRAEFALGKAIRKGQAEGTVRKVGERGYEQSSYTRVRHGQVEHVSQGDGRETDNSLKPGPGDFATRGELMGKTGTEGIYAMSDGVSPEVFEEALEEARGEDNLSRANVARKVRSARTPAAVPSTRETRADLIEELAAQGYSSRQMPAKVGVTEETVRQIARDFDIEIPADRSVNRTRRMDSTRIVTQTATALEGLAMGIDLIDYASLDPVEVGQWIDSLTTSVNALSKALKKIKESIQ